MSKRTVIEVCVLLAALPIITVWHINAVVKARFEYLNKNVDEQIAMANALAQAPPANNTRPRLRVV